MIECTTLPSAANNLVKCLATFPEPPKISVLGMMVIQEIVSKSAVNGLVEINCGCGVK
jgi:hypothetical protein